MFKNLKNSPFVINYRRMWPFVKPYWVRALIAMTLCIPIGSLDAVIAWCMKPYMNMVLVEKSTGPTEWFVPLFIIGFTICSGGLNYAATYLNVWVGTRITNDLKAALYAKLLSFETAFFDRQNSGDIVFRFNTDAEMASAGLLNNLKVFLSRFFSSLSLIGVLFYNSWQLSLIALLVLGCTFYPMAKVRKMIESLMNETIISGSRVITAYNETFAGNKTIMAYNYQQTQKAKFQEILNSLFRLSIKMTQRSSWLTPMMHIMVSIGIAATITYGSHLIVTHQLSPGGFVSFITALLMLYTPIKNMGSNYTAVQLSFLAIERVFALVDSNPGIQNKPDAKELGSIRNRIQFQNVHFQYVPDAPILNNICLDIKVGECIALVGNSGGGKTTIVNLLPRFYDIQSGQILIDGTDIRDYTLDSLRKNIAIVFQDNLKWADPTQLMKRYAVLSIWLI